MSYRSADQIGYRGFDTPDALSGRLRAWNSLQGELCRFGTEPTAELLRSDRVTNFEADASWSWAWNSLVVACVQPQWVPCAPDRCAQ
jgi:hypothetical protein